MSKTILVADDEERLVSLVRAYLKQEGFQVVTAKDGREALFVARQAKPDLIVLDLMMPEMDGYDFIRVHRSERDTPIIVLTANVDNALRHTPAGGTVTLAAGQNEGGVWLQVRDSGPGIAPEDLPHVFERFYRGDRARRRHEGGSGLGLAIARSIVEAHGGRIGVESPPGGGAVFTIELPAVG